MDTNEMIFEAVKSVCDIMNVFSDRMMECEDDMDKLMDLKNAVDNCTKAIRLLERNYE